MSNPALDKAIEIIKQFEGCRLTAYRDCAGVLTIGYGHTGPDVTSHSVWTQDQANKQLLQDVSVRMHQAGVASPILASHPNKLAAITSFIFNLGYGTYINSHHLLPSVSSGDWSTAAAALKQFIHADGIIEPGLVKRRNVEAELLLN